MKKSTIIRIYMEGDGHCHHIGRNLSPDDFGGTVPLVGDQIVVQDSNGKEPAKREVLEVVRRYLPLGQSQVSVALVVSSRDGLDGEADILGA